MTISDEPDEDADNLDDDDLLETYISPDPSGRGAQATTATDMPDWPPPRPRNEGSAPENETLAWFKANHVDWVQQMEFVLRAWVVARKQHTSHRTEEEPA